MMRRLATLLAGIVLVVAGGFAGVVWFTCRIFVPEDMCAVLVRQTGKDLPDGQLVAREPGQKGIQQEVLGPGRHWRDPFSWRWEIKPLAEVPAGDPRTWIWGDEPARRGTASTVGGASFQGKFPMVGVVTRKVGQDPPDGSVIVDRASPYKGILREVLTPGTYKLNPYVYNVELHPAVVIPAGFVGVVTNLFGDTPAGWGESPAASPPAVEGEAPKTFAHEDEDTAGFIRPLAEPGQRGTLRDVLQPGVYFINPKLQRVALVEIGYHEYSQAFASDAADLRIEFPSDTGYLIGVGVTVIWGIHPQHASQIINEYGGVDRVIERVINPQLRSICRNIGSTYAARDFIQGEKREKFQKDLTAELRRVCAQRNIDVLLALVLEIEVNAPGAGEATAVTEDLKRTIQQSYIAIESQLTKAEQREAATAKAKLEEERKKVDIARESIQADTRVMVTEIAAEARKEAATIDAEANLGVAAIQQEVALLDAQRVEIIGKATTDVEKFKKQAEADGYRMLVEAFGTPTAYNLYTFAENFHPESIRLIHAGEGTFWTDLKRFEEVGAAEQIKAAEAKK